MSDRCRLLTLNAAHGRGLSLYQGFLSKSRLLRNVDALARFLTEAEADLVALQEVDGDSHWNKRLDLPAMLAAKSDYPYALLGVNTRRSGLLHLSYGNALLSRYAVERWENRPFGNAALGEKGFLYAEVRAGRRTLPVAVVHLCYKSPSRRRSQVARLMEFLDARGEASAPVVCGDFNAPASDTDDAVREMLESLRARFGDYRIHPVDVPTFHALHPRRRLDFVFLPAAYRVLSCEVPRVLLSDHLPVIVDFEIP